MLRTITVLIGSALSLLTLAQGSFQYQYSYIHEEIPYGGMLNAVLPTEDGFFLGGEAHANLYGVSLTRTDANGTPQWVRTYDMSLDGFGSGAITTMATLAGGDILIAGAAPQLFFARISGDGTVVWARHMPFGTFNIATDMEITSDGNFVLVGKRQGNTFDAFVMKATPDGEVLWTKFYTTETNNSEFFTSIVGTPDGGTLAFGYWNYNLIYMNLLVVKLDPQGEVEWSKQYGQSPVNGFLLSNTIRATADGNYTLSGQSTNNASQTYEPLLFKIDPTGTVLWSSKWTSLQSSGTMAISNLRIVHEVMPDQSLVMMLGTNGYPSASVQVVHADAGGAPQSSNHLRNTQLLEVANDMVLLPDGGLAITGFNSTGTYRSSSFLFRTDALLHTPCNDSTSTATAAPFLLPTSDGGVTAVDGDFTYNGLTPTTNVIILEALNTCATIGINDLGATAALPFAIQPNPASEQLTITVAAGPVQVSLFDAQGQLVRSALLIEGLNTWDIGPLVPGPYVIVGALGQVGRFVVAR